MAGFSVPQFSSGPQAPAQEAAGGYNAALGSLNKSLKSIQGSDSSQLMQAQQGLAQNQGRVQQGAINSGLGNTSVAQTLQQAPLQTYNQNVAGINNNMQQQQMQTYGQMAGLQAQGGNSLGGLLQALQAQQMQNAQYDQSHPTISGARA